VKAAHNPASKQAKQSKEIVLKTRLFFTPCSSGTINSWKKDSLCIERGKIFNADFITLGNP
jgi:hypothetical protein